MRTNVHSKLPSTTAVFSRVIFMPFPDQVFSRAICDSKRSVPASQSKTLRRSGREGVLPLVLLEKRNSLRHFDPETLCERSFPRRSSHEHPVFARHNRPHIPRIVKNRH